MEVSIVMQIVLAVVPVVLGIVFAWVKKKAGNYAFAIEALEAGVLEAWDSYGRMRKNVLKSQLENDEISSAKFDTEDREKLKKIAKETADTLLKSKGLSLDKVIGGEALKDLQIKKIVDKFKS